MKIYVLLFTLALVPRLALWMHDRPTPQRFHAPDSVDYLELAQSLTQQGTFTTSQGQPVTRRTPGYPCFIALTQLLFKNSAAATILFQVAFCSLLPGLIYCLGLECGTSSRAAFMAGLCAAWDLNGVLHSLLLMSESFFCLVLGLGVLLFVRARIDGSLSRVAWAGFSFAIASFIRPIALYLPLTLLPWFGRRRTAAVFLISAYLLPGAWVLRNHALTGYWDFSSIASYNLLYYRAAGVVSRSMGQPVDTVQAQWRIQINQENPLGFSSQTAQDHMLARKALPILWSHPLATAQLTAIGAAKTMGGHAMDLLADLVWGPQAPRPGHSGLAQLTGAGTRWLLRCRPILWLPLILYLLFIASIYGFATRGVHRLWGSSRQALGVFLVWGAFYFLFLSSGAESYYRFRLPMMVFLWPLAAVGFSRSSHKKC